MGSYDMLSGFVKIIKKACKIFLRKGKLLPYITLLYLFFNSILFLSNFFSTKPLVTDFALKATYLISSSPTPGSSDFTNLVISLKDDARIFAGVEWIFIVANNFASLFFATATILTSAAALAFDGKWLCHLCFVIPSSSCSDLQRQIAPLVSFFHLVIEETSGIEALGRAARCHGPGFSMATMTVRHRDFLSLGQPSAYPYTMGHFFPHL
ncbi:hypothetical protein TorRG33x02_005120 [Trema orientale]|uniref:Uncharacterized protein n=1 Tax=Trema orientale TaxID=63057 RepID=A0A2P5FZW3_TREOI|nr:hypothetical protein TorRG33x02_005120 [Trema orientale]